MAVSLTNPLPPSLDPPNFHVCSLAYGHPIPLSHCLNALSLLPTGSVAVPYSTQLPQTRERFALPFTAIRSLCQITIEVGGRQVPPVVYLVPDKIQELALFVIAQCVREQETGGFATMGLGPLVDYVMNRQEAEGGGDRDRSPYSTTLRKWFFRAEKVTRSHSEASLKLTFVQISISIFYHRHGQQSHCEGPRTGQQRPGSPPHPVPKAVGCREICWERQPAPQRSPG